MLEVLIYLDLGYVLKKKESWIYVQLEMQCTLLHD